MLGQRGNWELGLSWFLQGLESKKEEFGCKFLFNFYYGNFQTQVLLTQL